MLIITIDGPAGSGKSTLAKLLATKLGVQLLDTGATYRAVALLAMRAGLDESHPDDVARIAGESSIELKGDPSNLKVYVNGEDVSGSIRTPEVSNLASRISALPGVRRELVKLQRRFADGRDVVLEGRDTGTVVFPNADLKIYLDASIRERAVRRSGDWPDDHDISKIEKEISGRDERDTTRPDSPLKIPDGALIIDSTRNSPEEVLELVIGEMRSRGLPPGH